MDRLFGKRATASNRLVGSVILGVVAGLIVSASWQAGYSLIIGWDVLALVLVSSIMLTLTRFDGASTRSHALKEDPGRAVADILLIVSSTASIVAVLILVVMASNAHGAEKIADITIGLITVILSWCVIQTTFMLKYARLYYSRGGETVDFNDTASPSYSDFAYLAFTIGMAFQVSDTNLKSRRMRSTVLLHSLLAYVFGTIIIASTINILASL